MSVGLDALKFERTYVVPEITLEYPRAPRIIALCGRERSGKDTAAKALRCFGYKQIAFAEALKKMLVAYLVASGMEHEIAHDHVYGDYRETPLAELNWRTVRHALQTLGTEWGRDLMHPDLWRDSTMRAIKSAPERRFVISDLRFPNEAEAVRAAGGIVLRIDRDDGDNADAHISEHLLDEITPDYVIQNVATGADAFAQIVQRFYCAAIAR